MPRSTMDDLIALVRSSIGDAAGADQVFSDDEIQAELDRARRDVLQAPLSAQPTFAADGTLSYLVYFADGGNWEKDATLVDAAFAALTPASSDYTVGRWTLQSSTLPPVYLTGQRYDVAAACANLCEAWAAKLSVEFDFLASGRTFKRSQAPKLLREAAKGFRARSWLRATAATRGDDLPGWYA